MDTQSGHLVFAKIACIVLLTLLAACGISVKDGDLEGEGIGTNRLTAYSDGVYAMQLDTEGLTCGRYFDDELVTATYLHEGGVDDGLRIGLRVMSPPDAGEAMTPANSSHDRNFEVSMQTPDGEVVAYSTARGRSEPGAAGSLTVLKSSDFAFSASVEFQVPVQGDGPGSPRSASFRGTFACERWDEDAD